MLAAMFSAQAQSTAFAENGHYVTLGYGFPNLYKSILRNAYSTSSFVSGDESYSYSTSGAGPLFLKYEYGIADHIGIGLVLGYYSAGVQQTYNYTEQNYNSQTGAVTTSNFKDVSKMDIVNSSLGLRFNYHFGSKEKLDPYIGFAAGYSYTKVTLSFSSNNPDHTRGSVSAVSPIPIYLGLTFGMRYYLSQNVGLYGEFGLDKWAVLQLGLAFKFQ